MNGPAAPRRIILCADDFGLSAGVNRAILELIDAGRLNATSVMTVAPALGRDQASALQRSAAARSCQIGLHLTLTAPFRPLTLHFRPLLGDAFLPLRRLLVATVVRRLDQDLLRAEILAQIAAFVGMFGRPPDYIDGHHHVHAFPQIRGEAIDAMTTAAPRAWIRQCGRASRAQRFSDPKSLVLDVLSAGVRARAGKAGISFNPAFAGAYDFSKVQDFAPRFGEFLDALPNGGLVMCHPGFVDDALITLDELTTQREREYEFLSGERFPALLAERNMTLA